MTSKDHDEDDPEKYNFRNVSILLKNDKFQNGSMTSWWEVHDPCGEGGLDPFAFWNKDHCQYLTIVLFNDKVFIGVLAFLSGYGYVCFKRQG